MKRDKDDARVSLAVRKRARFTCERCRRRHEENSMGLHAAHIFTRSIKATRHDMANLVCLCYGCHAYFHRNPLEFHEWVRKKMGAEKYDALSKRAHTLTKKTGV